MADLILHCGAREVEQPELLKVRTPPAEGRWVPLPHYDVIQQVKSVIFAAGFVIARMRLALSKGDARFFGVLDLESQLSDGVTLAVGVRNSHDRSFPIGFCAGSRVFCCDNLAFQSDLMVKRRHTTHGRRRFVEDIQSAVIRLGQFQEDESKRIAAMKTTTLGDDEADALILRAFEKNIINTQSLPLVLEEWRKPSHEEFAERSYWSLYNAFTSALAKKAQENPHFYAALTMRLGAHIAPKIHSV
jgi:hypothetical protein